MIKWEKSTGFLKKSGHAKIESEFQIWNFKIDVRISDLEFSKKANMQFEIPKRGGPGGAGLKKTAETSQKS